MTPPVPPRSPGLVPPGPVPPGSVPSGPVPPGLVQQSLGEAWMALPPALQAHHRAGNSLETGWLDIEFPAPMVPVLWALAALGALVRRRGTAVQTLVEKTCAGRIQRWRRTMRWADGQGMRFDSVWRLGDDGTLTESVRAGIGLEMRPFVVGTQLHFRGLRYVVRWGRLQFGIPGWLTPGAVSIVESALDDRQVAIDFRIRHPLFGTLYRYAGVFRVQADAA